MSCLEVIILSIGWEASIIYSVENFLKQLMLSLCNAFFFSLSLTLSLSLSPDFSSSQVIKCEEVRKETKTV